ncbi:DUF6162 family protein [Pseudomonas sp. nanlin1]|uniref:DUF6162 family protein n=1 Tax=Pseudomonas sp. nanlin1 TaxID=3040605 RepID=UPI00388E5000
MTSQVIRPAGASHETLYVLLLCACILLGAGAVVLWHQEPAVADNVQAYQVDARRDLSAGEQGLYADLRVTLDEIQLLLKEEQHPPAVERLADEGFAPFASDASSVSRGGHHWALLNEQAYLGLSERPEVAGTLLLRLGHNDVWLNRNAQASAPADLSDPALIASGWKQIVTQYDAGVTRQHRH